MPDNGPSVDLAAIIARATFDPGQYVARERTRSDYGGWDYEPLDAWQARAVLEALDRFDGLVAIAQGILDRHYPADVQLVCDRDSPDPGPRLAAALRDVLAVRT